MRLAHVLAGWGAFGRQDGEHWGHCSFMPEKISSVAPDPSREGTLWSPSLLSQEGRGAREERRACEWNLRRKGRKQKVTSDSGHTEEGLQMGGLARTLWGTGHVAACSPLCLVSTDVNFKLCPSPTQWSSSNPLTTLAPPTT